MNELKTKIFISDEIKAGMSVGALSMLHTEYDVKILPIHAEDGLVCIGCGNRGHDAPFIMHTTGPTKVTITSNGELLFEVFKDVYEELIDSVISGDGLILDPFGIGRTVFANSNQNHIQCSNCNGSVISLKSSLQACKDEGCPGCPVCNKPMPAEELITHCARCQIPRAMCEVVNEGFEPSSNSPVPDPTEVKKQDNEIFNNECNNWGCKFFDLRYGVYDFHLQEVYCQILGLEVDFKK